MKREPIFPAIMQGLEIAAWVVFAIVWAVYCLSSQALEQVAWNETYERIETTLPALQDYRADQGAFPTSAQGLQALRVLPPEHREGERYLNDPLPYLPQDADTEDGWGRPLLYRSGPDWCEVSSLGKDNKPGGTGPNADLHQPCAPWDPPNLASATSPTSSQ